jgi:hypothetical protein
VGCDDGREGHFGYGPPGPGYAGYPPQPQSGEIRFEWSLPGAASASGDDDAGVLAADSGVTISGSVRQSACDAIGATQFQALLFDQGTIVAVEQSPCNSNSGTLRVGSNDYTATAALVTEDAVPVTETKVIPSFVVAPGETQVIHITFGKL